MKLRKNKFNGITEFLAKISKTKTYMLMKGDFFNHTSYNSYTNK